LERFRFDYDFHAKIVALMQRNGVGLLAGTDTGDPYVVPGRALHDELELLVQAGLSPAQALRTATLNPARYFGIQTQAGSVDRGKRADLVLLDANPLEDIRNVRKISAVILRGRLLDRARLDRLTKESDAIGTRLPHLPHRSPLHPLQNDGVHRRSGVHALA
jgi:imidazolonepropionase-like amidohydrolase